MSGYDRAQVQGLRRAPIAPGEKGFGGPAHVHPTSAAALAQLRPHLADGWLGAPSAVLRRSALDHNLAAMAADVAAHGAELWPHAKTTMAPQLVAEQLDAGATGVTVATVRQARVLRAFGVSTLLVANQVVDPGEVTWLELDAAQHPQSPVTCFVDSVDGVELLGPRGPGVPTPVLLEVGHVGGRSGVRDVEAAVRVATAASRSRSVALRGVAAFEGSVRAGSREQTEAGVRELCERVADVAGALAGLGMLPDRPVVSAGGSAFFDVVLSTLGGDRPWRLVLRSGCYLTHDHGLYAEVAPIARGASGPVLQPAVEVWCRVHARPEPGLVVLGAGRRDLSFDAGFPVVLEAVDRDGEPRSMSQGTVERLYDQHAVLAVEPGCDLRVGDQVRLGISHPCGTFDRWRWLPVVDEDRIVDAVRTLF